MNKYCNIKPDLYPYNVIVSIDQTTEELHIKVKKYFISFESFKSLLGEFKNRSGDCTFSSEGKVAIIRLTAQKDKIDTLSILNHELLHATFFRFFIYQKLQAIKKIHRLNNVNIF